MIKLELAAKPERLTPEFQAHKTDEFKASGKTKDVWNIKWLKEAILQMSFSKCCYSEIRLQEESKYMEVEHFHPKDLYPEDVMEWGNLLPACKKCNASKGNHDTKAMPIVNPFTDNPGDFLYFRNYRYNAKNEKGRRSIDILDLNDMAHFVRPRYKVGSQIQEELATLAGDIDKLNDPLRINRYLKQIKNLLKQGGRKETYAALVATVILEDQNFSTLHATLLSNNRWDDEFESLVAELKFCALTQ